MPESMESALEKIVRLSRAEPVRELVTAFDEAAVLVAAATDSMRELLVVLAKKEDDDEDDSDGGSTNQSGKGGSGDTKGGGDNGKPFWANKKKSGGKNDNDSKGGGNDHSGHAGYKAAVKKGLDPKAAAAACAKADQQVKATSLCEGALAALEGLNSASGNWVEATAVDSLAVTLTGGKKPFGNVRYADPGFQSDGKKRYPLDTEEHVRASLSHISQAKYQAEYADEDYATVRRAIESEAKKKGIQVADKDKVAAAAVSEPGVLALAAAEVAMRHGPFNGSHAHPHTMIDVHKHSHTHNGDSNHDMHPHGDEGPASQDGRDW